MLVACAIAPLAPIAAAQAATARQPVLFVHGYLSDASTWDTMVSRFRAAGYTDAELFPWSYNYNQSNTVTANEVQAKVDEIRRLTGWSKVDVVTHSMGGLSSRYYLKNLSGTAYVDAWVSLGGPNHGTDTAYFCGTRSCLEMRPGSSFLTSLNATDETPGAARYGTWWSPCDTTINPDSSVSLSGAANTKTACLSHSALHEDATVFGQVRTFIG